MHFRFLIVAAVCAVAAAAPLPESATAQLKRHAGFTDGQISAISRGYRVVRSISTKSAEEVAFAGAIRLPITLDRYLERLRAGTLYRTGENVLQIGHFSETPALTDLDEFRIEPAYKQGLVDAISTFESTGALLAGPLGERPRSVDRSAQFDPLVRQAAYLRERMPAAYEHLLRYPRGRSRGADDFYLWTELTFGLRPITRVAYLSIWEDQAQHEAIVLTEQIYANRYFEVSFQIDHLIADPADGSVYLITLNYGRSELLANIAGRMIRPLVVSRTLSLAEKTLDQAARDLRAQR